MSSWKQTLFQLRDSSMEIQSFNVHNGAALIEDSKALMAQTGTTISHIPRLANQTADSLSRFGAEQEESLVITYDIT